MAFDPSKAETTQDHRNQEVPLYRGALDIFPASDLCRKQLRKFRKAARIPDQRFFRFSFGGCLVVFVLALFVVLARRVYGLELRWAVAGGCLAWGMYRAFALVWDGTAYRLRAASLVRAMLAEWRCPSCAYDLRHLKAHEDGCVICPECGAAWRVNSGAKQMS